MADGIGCKCAAQCEGECGCGVDWRSSREVELEARVTELEAEVHKAISERPSIITLQVMQDKVKGLEAENERLSKRDCNAVVQLCFDDGENPFAREDLKIVDVGVSDNIYIVESKTLEKVQAKVKELEAENERLRKVVEQISNWTKAYPLSVFPEPDWQKVHTVLKENGISLDQISASNMRHVISGVEKILTASEEGEDE